MPRLKKETKEEALVSEVEQLPELESIVLDTEKKQKYWAILEDYKTKNPVKFEQKRKAFTKKMLSL